MSRKRFTHFIRKVFALEFLPTGKFWLFVSLPVMGRVYIKLHLWKGNCWTLTFCLKENDFFLGTYFLREHYDSCSNKSTSWLFNRNKFGASFCGPNLHLCNSNQCAFCIYGLKKWESFCFSLICIQEPPCNLLTCSVLNFNPLFTWKLGHHSVK